MSVTVGYWDLRGLGEPIRLVLRYAGVQYREIRYQFADNFEDTNLRQDWLKDKFKLGLDFPNIPFYIEGDLKLTHSKTIMQYLGRKHGLIGQTESEKIRIDIIESYIEDFRCDGLRHVVYTPVFEPNADFETLKAEYISKLDSYLTEISNFLGSYEWMSGNGLSYVDFWVYEILDWNRLFKTNCLNKYKNLMDYMNRLEALPPINRYIHSKHFNRLPIFAPFARFGGNKEVTDNRFGSD